MEKNPARGRWPLVAVPVVAVGLIAGGLAITRGDRASEPEPSSLQLASAPAYEAMAATQEAKAARQAIVLSPDLPSEAPLSDSELEFYDFAWKVFVALNWPATPGVRGVADTSKQIGDTSLPVVWSTWKADYDLFQPEGAAPTDWSSTAGQNPCGLTQVAPGTSILESFDHFSIFNQPTAGALVAQNGTYARFEANFNQAYYDASVQQKLYLRSSLGQQVDFPAGSMVVKGAWRQIASTEPANVRERYYITQAWVWNSSTNACEQQDMALVGLHIIYKTPQRPDWVWMSFEQMDNVPSGSGKAPPGGYSFNNGGAPKTLTPPQPPPAFTSPPEGTPTPAQVVRLNGLYYLLNTPNAQYQDALKGTVWSHYQLVVTQWMTHKDGPYPPVGGMITYAYNTANVTMETYDQANAAKGSCMSCHSCSCTQRALMIVERAYPPMDNAPCPCGQDGGPSNH